MSSTIDSVAAPSPKRSVDDLRERMRGPVLVPGEAEYDDARRMFNTMIDRYPCAIARVLDAHDVAAVVRFARESGIPVTVRSGGHNIAGHAIQNDALMIDLSLMQDVEVDADQRVGRVGGGARLGGMIEAMERHGFVTPTGTDFDTGVGGLTLGGGYGWLCGKWGMAVDNLLGAEMVLADGQIVYTDDNRHPDLFWAIRGGSGNFGVVTRFDFRLYPLTETLSGLLVYPFAMAKEVVQYARSVREQAPDELTVYSGMLTGPDGQRMVGTIVCWCGDMAEGERVLAPIRAWGAPVLDTIQPMPYSKVNTLLTQQFSTVKLRGYWKQSMLPQLDDEVIDLLIEHFERAPSPLTIVAVTDEHGAQRRADPAATAFPHRDSPLAVLMLSSWLDAAEDDANIAWARTMSAALEPWSTGGRYVNESEDERISGVFRDNLPRLREIKRRYDPDNFFRANFNIAPA